MPTANNGAKARSITDLADAAGSLRELSTGLQFLSDHAETPEEKERWHEASKHMEALAGNVTSIQREVSDRLGHGRLPESTADLKYEPVADGGAEAVKQ